MQEGSVECGGAHDPTGRATTSQSETGTLIAFPTPPTSSVNAGLRPWQAREPGTGNELRPAVAALQSDVCVRDRRG